NLCSENELFLIPFRKPPWVDGGNRPSWVATQSYRVGKVVLQIGGSFARPRKGKLKWKLYNLWSGELVDEGAERAHIGGEFTPGPLSQVQFECRTPAHYSLYVSFGGERGHWLLTVFAATDLKKLTSWSANASAEGFPTLPQVDGKNLITKD